MPQEHAKPEAAHSPLAFVLEALALVGVLATLALIAMNWNDLPEQLPRAFSITGEPTAWAGRGVLVFLVVLQLVSYAVLTILGRYPQAVQYLRRITRIGARRHDHSQRTKVALLKAEWIWVLALTTWGVIRIARGEAEGLGIGFIPAAYLLIFGTIVYYALRER